MAIGLETLDGLIEAHHPSIFALCYRLVGSVEDAEDLTQETFIRVTESYAKFEGRSAFKTWAYRIATNTCYNFLKSARHRREVVMPDPLATTDEFLNAVDPDARPESVRESLEYSFICVLSELPPLQRLVVVLRDALGWSVKETATALNSSPAAVKNIHSRARKHLQSRRRATLPPSHPDAEKFMSRFAQRHVEGDATACVHLFDDRSVVYLFPMRKLVGRQEIAGWYGEVMKMPPTLFVGVKVNGNLGAACYHPTPDGVLTRTGVVMLELEQETRRGGPLRIAQALWAMQPQNLDWVPTPQRIETPEDMTRSLL